ncbi:hypothetical protein [Neorhizobium galegae]|uniref:hypothetical protein n=1 Tax=Neorhizobium galegae TaxID=399 RepID=UPI000621358D|nr:hypothetical protein [Neorhizobium galegae]KAB1125678.1 hypothetical protein F4V90_00695 [Neorhizobium galegae]MCQ1805944.1 hypothetical protein [Neorhizobium galegae]CDZ59361.1 Hypothetical protein NGAL_HAMBI2566_34680 [Neorhizobium galegae bv. orientalis]
MYILAAEIVVSEAAPGELKRAARRVSRALEDVVDKPIADALVLARARARFAELVAALEGSVGGTKRPPPGRDNRAAPRR